ncbi:342_t:CDS:2 [Ambispora gerdemannii]|uniref:342_t:CDS:1 n=1 Tax=Ambispora gerdemannii TaxID=144530 RepID=A0A9N9AN49_9GLOM|nr:342_t:CDS:2 [Ambispora gerdemannii]
MNQEQALQDNFDLKKYDRPLLFLPNEITLLIFSFLGQLDKVNAARVSRVWCDAIYSPSLWHEAMLYNVKGFKNNILNRLSQVEFLEARASGISDEEVRLLVIGPAGKTLKVLDLSVGPQLTNKCLIYIGYHCVNLEKLFLEGCNQITDIQPLEMLVDRLKTIVLSYNENLSNAVFWNLSSFGDRITKLDLDGCPQISDAGIEHLAAHLHGLRYLAIDGQGINDAPVISIFEHCTDLVLFSMSFCDLTDVFLDGLIRNLCPSLRYLRLRKGAAFTEIGFCRLFEHLTLRGHSFVSLDLSECTNVTNIALESLNQPQLRRLNLDWCWNVNDSNILEILKRSPKIEELFITGCNDVTCESLVGEKIASLKILNLFSCRMVERTIICGISKSNPSLYIVDYYGEVYKDGKKIGLMDQVFIKEEKVDSQERWGLLNVGSYLRFYRGNSV